MIRAGVHSFQLEDEIAGGTKAFDIEATATLEMSGEERTSLESANNPWPGVSVKQTRGAADITILDKGTLSVQALQNGRRVVALLGSATGKAYSVRGSVVGKVSLDMLNGTIPLRVEGIVTERVVR